MINPYSLDMYSAYDEYDEIDDEIINKDIERAWTEHELEEQIDTIVQERKVRQIEREYQIERIAKSAVDKLVPFNLIYKFFKDYKLNLREQTLFWQHFGYLKVLLIK